MTEFNDNQHFGLFVTGTTLTSSTGKFVRMSELVLAALRAAGVLDNLVDGVEAPDFDRLWLDKNFDPAVLKEWDATGSSWVPITYGRLFGRAALGKMTVTGGTGNAIAVAQPAGFQANRLYLITPTATNDAATTIQVAGVGTFAVKYGDGSEISAGEFIPGRQSALFFTGSVFEVVLSAVLLSAAVDLATTSATLAQAWAEGTEPGGAGTKSAKEWAQDAEAAGIFNRVRAEGTISGVGPYEAGATIGSANNIDIKVGGVLFDHDLYTISGSTFTFLANPGAGQVWESMVQSNSRQITVPADASVTEEKLSADLAAKVNAVGTEAGISILDHGGSESNTTAQNKVALQAAIAACDAAGGGVVIVPWPIDYGHIPTDTSTYPDFDGVVNDMMVLDHSPSSMGFATEGAKQGWVEKRWFHTPQTTPVGQHDGNGFHLKADWHPYYMVDTNPEVIPFGSRPSSYNYRASYYWGLRGKPVYQLQMGNGEGNLSDAALKGLNWLVYDDNIQFKWGILSFDYATGRIAYGVSTTAPLACHDFYQQDPAAAVALFRATGTENTIIIQKGANPDNTKDVRWTLDNTNYTLQFPNLGNVLQIARNSRAIITGGNFTVSGVLSKTSGTFDIPHPDPEKSETHRLRHSFVESPTRGDNIYRFSVDVEFANQPSTVEIPLPGYWPHLNENPQVWVSAADHFGQAFGKVNEEGTAIVVTYDGTPGTYNALLIGTRCDQLSKVFDEKGVEYELEQAK
ncbi:MAG: hypothetical protein ACK4P4_13275 [Allorhizobium sp.]